MKNVYIASVNPMHFSHLNTYNEARMVLQEKVFLCIGQNELKSEGLFSLKERVEIAVNFYGISRDDIVVLPNKEKIIEVIQNAEKIVRGIRTEKDLLELENLACYYGVEGSKDKLMPIMVPEKMKEISSSKLITYIQANKYKLEYGWIPEKLLKEIKKKLNHL